MKRMIVGALLLASTTAHADGRKSAATAEGLSIAGTLGGAALTLAGIKAESGPLTLTGVGLLIVGPGAGHLYAGDADHSLLTSLIRLAGLGVIGYGFSKLPPFQCEDFCEDDEADDTQAGWLLIGGAVTFLGATVWDLVDAPRAAHRYNLSLTPTVLPATDGRAPGLSLGGTF